MTQWGSYPSVGRHWVGDFNGDGKTDYAYGDNNQVSVYISNGVDGFNPSTVWGTGYEEYQRTYVADFNGDGRADFAYADGGNIHVKLSTGSNFGPNQSWGSYSGNGHHWVGDFNGDGKADWAYGDGNNITVYTTVDTPAGLTFNAQFWGTGYGDANRTHIADFNGDGKSDIAYADNNNIYVKLSTGTQFTANQVWGNYGSYAYHWVGDFNGDGKSDYALGDGGNVNVFLSKGNIFDNATVWGSGFSSDVYIADFNGDGKADHAYEAADGRIWVKLSNSPFPDLITKITGGFGSENNITYKPLTDASVYTRESSAQYPVYDFQKPIYVVADLSVTNGLGFTYSYNHTYKGGQFHQEGRDWIGFREMQSVDLTANARTTNTYYQDSFPKYGLPHVTKVDQNSPYIALRETTRTYEVGSASSQAGVYFVGLDEETLVEKEGGLPRTSKREMFYDSFAWGNLITTIHHGDLAIGDDTRTESTEWIVDEAFWRHRPKTVKLANSAGETLRQKWLSYDDRSYGAFAPGDPGLLTREELDGGDPQGSGNNNPVTGKNPVTTYVYDNNNLGVRNKVTDARGCRTRTVHDGSWTFPQTVYTCENVTGMNFSMGYTYDPRFGVNTVETDWNGQSTNHRYDNFGRLSKTWGPVDSEALPTVSQFYLDWGSPGAQRVLTYRREQHGAGNVLWSQEFFDGLGRGIAKQQEGPDTDTTGKTIFSQTWYDSRDLVIYQWVPYFINANGSPAETPYYTIFTHDALGRQTRVDHPDGTWAVANYFLPGSVALTDENGKDKFKYTDVFGQLTQVTEKNGSALYVTTYKYDAAGALLRVVNAAGHHTTMAYDKLGRKEAMCDPNMGTDPFSTTTCSISTPGAWLYTYNPAGDLKTQKDANPQTLYFDYDALGRPTVKRKDSSAGDILVQWTYDTTHVAPLPAGADYPKGRVTQVHQPTPGNPNVVTTQFAYDKMGRTLESKRQILGVWHSMKQTYDGLSRIKTETFPDNETVTYSYNEAGWVKSATATSGPNYINDIQYNARGQKTQLTYGNGLVTTWTHHATNFRVTNKTTSNNQQNLGYGYDNVGNILSIADGTGGTAYRTFTYDDLHRLASAVGPFGTNQSQQNCSYGYSPVGNLENKCGATISYGHAMHPSAASAHSGTGKSYSYDANGNMLNRGSQSLLWDYDNRVTSITTGGQTTSHEYDYTGMRVKKAAPAGTTLFPFSGYEISPSSEVTKYIKIGVETFATKRGANKFYYHNDHLGGVHVITDSGGNRCQLNEYDPWGAVSKSEGPTPGSQPTCEPTHRFNGKELDPESGLYYYGGRYYDQELGRFIGPDPFVQEDDEPQNLNRYSYTLNNPQKYMDPSGYFWINAVASNFVRNLIRNPGQAIGQFFGSIAAGWATAGIGTYAGLSTWAIGTTAGAAAGATSAAIGGGNPLYGGLAGGWLGFVGAGGLSYGGPILGNPFTTVGGNAANRLQKIIEQATEVGALIADTREKSNGRVFSLSRCTVDCYAYYISGALNPYRPNTALVPFSAFDNGITPSKMKNFNARAESLSPGSSLMINPGMVYSTFDNGFYSSGDSTIDLIGTLSKDSAGKVSFEGIVRGRTELYNFNRPGLLNTIGRMTPGRDFRIRWIGERAVSYP